MCMSELGTFDRVCWAFALHCVEWCTNLYAITCSIHMLATR